MKVSCLVLLSFVLYPSIDPQCTDIMLLWLLLLVVVLLLLATVHLASAGLISFPRDANELS